MPRRSVVFAAAAALIAAVAFAATRPALSATTPLKIMPLGDSITAGPGCWRAYLWDHLQKTGYTNVDFVGTQNNAGSCSVSFDADHEGHGGLSSINLANQGSLPGWLSATNPDIVLMHLGTNDMWGNYIPTSNVIAAFSTLVDQMRANNPNMKILVAQIIPMSDAACGAGCYQEVQTLNAAIPGWAASKTTAQSPIVVVDQWTGFDVTTDTNEGVHPNDSGFQKMAARWYPALIPFLGGPTTTTPSRTAPTTASTTPSRTAPTTASTTPSRTAPTTASTTPSRTAPTTASTTPSRTVATTSAAPTGGVCAATYSVTNQWPGGFQGQVSVTNRTAAATSAWTVTFSFANGQQITQSWNATITQSGAAVTAKNVSWNGSLPSGGSASFGFLASYTGTNAVPAVTCTVS